MIEDQGERQIKALEEHGKQILESTEIAQKDFNIGRDSTPPKEENNF